LVFNVNKYKHEAVPREMPPDANDRHLSMLEAIKPYAKQTVQKNVTDVDIEYSDRKTKLVLVLLPQWAAHFPPFNLARLSAVAKHTGYQTKILDINARCYNEYRNNIKHTGDLDFEMWNPSSNWRWVGEHYYNFIHPIFEDIFNEYIKSIVEFNPEVVGFSMYQFSEEPTKWMIQELKRLLPNVKIAVGGSNVQHGWFQLQPYYDYVVNGEGEEAILRILEEVENGITHESTQYIKQPEEQRINLNNLPMPDYSSIDFNDYEIPNGALSELSRGCTAKCTFCEETHFWKYRQRQAVDALTEIEWLYYNKGTDIIWFIDSLVNGNLKELRAFAKGVIAKGLKIKWSGYARCDGRMDYEYLKDLADSGCMALNYGCESGSQKVLDDIDKGVTVAEMEQNFRDGKAVGIMAATNWIVGFPTETYQDFADTMTFLWRMRNMNINNIGTGMGFGMGPETIVGQNPDRFNLSGQKYLGYWITKDFGMGGAHVHTRVKSFNIFVDNLVTDEPFWYPKRTNLKKYHYDLKFHDETNLKEINYEKFNYNIIKTELNPYADSLVNEIWPILRTLWRTRGGYDIKIKFDPALDFNEFGDHFGTGIYNADYKFSINDAGQWTADFKIDFIQDYDSKNDPREAHRHGPFFAQEFSRMNGNAALRARKLAKPSWGLDGRNQEDFNQLLNEEYYLNQTVQWSFNFKWTGAGDWSDYKKYEIETSNERTEKDSNYQPVTFYKATRL
jgi:anaerobic magnesium-protoporphyrin IX monomethyl ester cyclase